MTDDEWLIAEYACGARLPQFDPDEECEHCGAAYESATTVGSMGAAVEETNICTAQSYNVSLSLSAEWETTEITPERVPSQFYREAERVEEAVEQGSFEVAAVELDFAPLSEVADDD